MFAASAAVSGSRSSGPCGKSGSERAEPVVAGHRSVVQGHPRGSRRNSRRPVRTIRPAMFSSRRRSRLGSEVRTGLLSSARCWVQLSRSAASWTSSSQIWLAGQRQVAQPGVFQAADPASARAGSRCCTSSSRSRPPTALLANTVIRQPSASVIRNCAPGCGRSRRAMIRIPGGQGLPVPAGTCRVSSATGAPSRG